MVKLLGMRPTIAISLLSFSGILCGQEGSTWVFGVSGDSRNCGDVVMPAIAKGVLADKSAFYWHLGDYRAIYRFDQDYEQAHKSSGGVMSITDYLSAAWPDFIQNQLVPFGDLPVYLALGNHETIPPKTRSQIVEQFADWLNDPAIRAQRLRDDPTDHLIKTYFHFVKDGIDFITLDNASGDSFDQPQMRWLKSLLDRDREDGTVRALVVGMHEALPDSIAVGHSMSSSMDGTQSGRQVYQWLLRVHQKKPVYVLASHSHYYMEGIFNTDYINTHGGALPGWIVGTAGAERVALPDGKANAIEARDFVYGYLSGVVTADKTNPIQFTFKQLAETDVPASVVAKYSPEFVHECWANNPAR